jgi:hypothetical protein
MGRKQRDRPFPSGALAGLPHEVTVFWAYRSS